jgi:thioredoxin 1
MVVSCRTVSQITEQLAKEYFGRVEFGKVDIDENHLTADSFGIQSIPATVILKK